MNQRRYGSALYPFLLLCVSQLTVVSLFQVISQEDASILATAASNSSTSNSLTSNSSNIIPDFNFAAAGDWACNPNTDITVRNIDNKNPDLVLGLGDYSYQTSADCWLELVEPIAEKIKIALGNHERIIYAPSGSYESSVLMNQYMNHFNLTQQYYSFNFQNVHFTIMSTETSLSRGSEQYNFVNNDLAAASTNSSTEWIIVVLHEPLYNSPYYQQVGTNLDLIEIYQPLFDKYGADLVLSGDVHNYQRSYPLRYNSTDPGTPIITSTDRNNYIDMSTRPGGQIYVTVGTGGAPLNRALNQQAAFIASQQAEAFGYLDVEILNNGKTLKASFYANDGIIDDSFTINKVASTNVSAAIASPSLLSSSNQSNITQNNVLTYENRDLGISIQHPVGWQQLELGRGIVTPLYPVFLPVSENSTAAPFFERLQIYVYNSTNGSLDDLVTKEIDGFKSQIITDFAIADGPKNDTLLADVPAYRLVYTGKEGPFDFKAQELWAIKGNRVYNLLYTAPPDQYERNLPTIQQMIDSFELTK